MASCMDVWPILEQKKQSAGGEAPQSSSRPPPASLLPAQASSGLSAGCSSDGNAESDTLSHTQRPIVVVVTVVYAMMLGFLV
mmetsp:Transcript_2784/g.5616  ORF Transcript_2784/g.5616 Transcript_2784/m.5616 type:complete len:82 (+) Transcript_2784:238-483(+)